MGNKDEKLAGNRLGALSSHVVVLQSLQQTEIKKPGSGWHSTGC